MRPSVALAAALVTSACGHPIPPAASTPPPTSRATPAPVPAPAHRLAIRFDYRFDDGYFSQHPERRVTLEAAAAVWSDLLTDDFPAVPAAAEPLLLIADDGHAYRGDVARTASGRACQRWTSQSPHAHDRTPDVYPNAGLGDHAACRNPDGSAGPWCYTTDPAVRWEYCDVGLAPPLPDPAALPPIDDLVVFVRVAETGSTKASARAHAPDDDAPPELRARWSRLPFQPWAGTLTVNAAPARPWFFDPTPHTVDDVPSGTHYDFFMTALHELGHILGFMRAALGPHVRGDRFHGPRALARNGGAPVPLAPDSGHLENGFAGPLRRPHLEDLLMTPTAQIDGLRIFPSQLEIAMLEDLGYHASPAALERYDPGGAHGGSPYRDPAPDPRPAPASFVLAEAAPVALWRFDDARYLNQAAIGHPVLYRAPVGVIADAARDGAVRLGGGAFLHAEHDVRAGNCGGVELDCYTLVMDVRRPADAGGPAALFNTNVGNTNAAELWLDADGALGEGNAWSSWRLAPGRFVRLALVVDLAAGTLTAYADGHEVLVMRAGERDGRYSIEVDPPRLVLFGDGRGGATGRVDVRLAALYARALTAPDVAALGAAE